MTEENKKEAPPKHLKVSRSLQRKQAATEVMLLINPLKLKVDVIFES